MQRDTCSNCGHGFDERCERMVGPDSSVRCHRLFACGKVSETCGVCGELVCAWKYDGEQVEWLRQED
jgi:hypothetical protein